MLDMFKHALAVTLLLRVRADGEARHFGHFLVRKRVQSSTAEDHTIVLNHREVINLSLNQLAPALDERAVCLDVLVLCIPVYVSLIDNNYFSS